RRSAPSQYDAAKAWRPAQRLQKRDRSPAAPLPTDRAPLRTSAIPQPPPPRAGFPPGRSPPPDGGALTSALHSLCAHPLLRGCGNRPPTIHVSAPAPRPARRGSWVIAPARRTLVSVPSLLSALPIRRCRAGKYLRAGIPPQSPHARSPLSLLRAPTI